MFIKAIMMKAIEFLMKLYRFFALELTLDVILSDWFSSSPNQDMGIFMIF